MKASIILITNPASIAMKDVFFFIDLLFLCCLCEPFVVEPFVVTPLVGPCTIVIGMYTLY